MAEEHPPSADEQPPRKSTTARLNPLGHGQYLIEVAGVSIKSRYPENRMCKALLLAGVTGKLEVYGPSADRSRDVLRLTVDIEGYGRRQKTEAAGGFRFVPWTENSLAPLHVAADKLKRSFADRHKPLDRTQRLSGDAVPVPDRTFKQSGNRQVRPDRSLDE